jgi:hypothetical protein
MLIFETLSAGVFAILLGVVALLVLVGVYDYIVWPLTKWDFAGVNVDQFRPWWQWAAGLTFATGSLAGFWCFSGAAFRPKKAAPQRPVSRTPSAAALRARQERLRKQNQRKQNLFNP